MNIYARFETVFRAARGARSLTCPGGADWSYERLLAEIHRAAVVLAVRNVLPGDRVLVQVEKTPQAVALYLACLKIGAVYVPINTAYTAPEVAYFIADCQPKLFVVGGRSDTSAPKPGRRFAFAMRRLRLRPSHADLTWNIHLRSLRSLRRLFHGRRSEQGFASRPDQHPVDGRPIGHIEARVFHPNPLQAFRLVRERSLNPR